MTQTSKSPRYRLRRLPVSAQSPPIPRTLREQLSFVGEVFLYATGFLAFGIALAWILFPVPTPF